HPGHGEVDVCRQFSLELPLLRTVPADMVYEHSRGKRLFLHPEQPTPMVGMGDVLHQLRPSHGAVDEPRLQAVSTVPHRRGYYHLYRALAGYGPDDHAWCIGPPLHPDRYPGGGLLRGLLGDLHPYGTRGLGQGTAHRGGTPIPGGKRSSPHLIRVITEHNRIA